MPRSNPSSGVWQVLLIVLVASAVFLPRIFELDVFVTVDEPEWLFQSANFYYALGQRDFAETYRREHPGVTALWAGATAYLVDYPEYRALGQGYIPTYKGQEFLRNHDQQPLELLATARAVMVLLTTAVLTLAFIYGRRLLGLLPALVGILLIAFSPFHLALTRVLHLDGMEANFLLLSVLAALTYLYRGQKWLDLVVAGAAAGIGMITKSPAAIALPFVGLMLLLAFIQARRDKTEARVWQDLLLPGIVVGLVALLAILIAWPAMWVHPVEVLRSVFIDALAYAEEGHGGDNYFNGVIYLSPGIIDWRVPQYYPINYLWRTTPLVLFGLLALAWAWFKKAGPLAEPAVRKSVAGLVYFALLFWLFMTLGSKKFDRYAIPAHLPLMLASGVGWAALAQWIWSSTFRYRQPTGVVLLSLVVLGQLASALPHFPYYFTYYNPLMGGAKKAPDVMLIGWGEGLDQAAEYLKGKPYEGEFLVMSSYDYGPLSFFLDGETSGILRFNAKFNPEKLRLMGEADYLVVYANAWQRTPPELDQFAGVTPEHVIWINGLEYARIYPRAAFPLFDQFDAP